jgi:hypothetical protein
VILSQDDVQALKADRGYVVVTVHFLPPTRPPLRLELALEKVSMVQGKEGVLGPMDLLDGRTVGVSLGAVEHFVVECYQPTNIRPCGVNDCPLPLGHPGPHRGYCGLHGCSLPAGHFGVHEVQ